MKKISLFITSCVLAFTIAGCNEKKATTTEEVTDTIIVTVPDSAIYGTVNEATTMHNLVINTEDGKTMEFELDVDTLTDIQGGIFSGDRITVVTADGENGKVISKMLNLTTLLGKWTSLDRNFEIKEDGVVTGAMSAESNPYTHWSTANANLILNTDTFQVLLLGPDSLTLENDKGIFVYKRQHRARK